LKDTIIYFNIFFDQCLFNARPGNRVSEGKDCPIGANTRGTERNNPGTYGTGNWPYTATDDVWWNGEFAQTIFLKENDILAPYESPEAGGIHGYGMRRGAGYGVGATPADWAKNMDEVVIAIMIEKKGAIENLEEILSVKGVDMVQFGPADYSISIGKPGQVRDPDIQKAHQFMIETALSASSLYLMPTMYSNRRATFPT